MKDKKAEFYKDPPKADFDFELGTRDHFIEERITRLKVMFKRENIMYEKTIDKWNGYVFSYLYDLLRYPQAYPGIKVLSCKEEYDPKSFKCYVEITLMLKDEKLIETFYNNQIKTKSEK